MRALRSSAYRRCVSHLLSLCSPSAVRLASPSFLCAVRGVGRLLSKGHHFNCRKELVECAVPLLNHRLPAIRRVAFDSVVAVFVGDQQGDATADCVRVIAKMVNRKRQRSRHSQRHHLPVAALTTHSRPLSSSCVTFLFAASSVWSVQSEALTCLLRLPLSDQQPAQSRASSAPPRLALAVRRKEKKRLAKVSSRHKRASIQVDDVLLARDMAEGEAVVNARTKAKLQTASVTHMFQVFFTLIKPPSNGRWHKHYQRLMPTIMKGMER